MTESSQIRWPPELVFRRILVTDRWPSTVAENRNQPRRSPSPHKRVYVRHVVRPRRCGPFLPKPQPASNRVPLHQRRYRLVSILKAGNPSGLAKRLCVSLAQGLGHPTNVCHRPNGRRRETESRLPYPQGNQATQQGPSAAPVAVHKNTNLVSQFSGKKLKPRLFCR